MNMLPLIAIEGPDGAGHATYIRNLTTQFTEAGIPYHLSAEPNGNAPVGRLIRRLLSGGVPSPQSFLHLWLADRHQHYETLTALWQEQAQGSVPRQPFFFISDRSYWSTFAYQGCLPELMETIHRAGQEDASEAGEGDDQPSTPPQYYTLTDIRRMHAGFPRMLAQVVLLSLPQENRERLSKRRMQGGKFEFFDRAEYAHPIYLCYRKTVTAVLALGDPVLMLNARRTPAEIADTVPVAFWKMLYEAFYEATASDALTNHRQAAPHDFAADASEKPGYVNRVYEKLIATNGMMVTVKDITALYLQVVLGYLDWAFALPVHFGGRRYIAALPARESSR